jgi:hypothetical protein
MRLKGEIKRKRKSNRGGELVFTIAARPHSSYSRVNVVFGDTELAGGVNL